MLYQHLIFSFPPLLKDLVGALLSSKTVIQINKITFNLEFKLILVIS